MAWLGQVDVWTALGCSNDPKLRVWPEFGRLGGARLGLGIFCAHGETIFWPPSIWYRALYKMAYMAKKESPLEQKLHESAPMFLGESEGPIWVIDPRKGGYTQFRIGDY